MSGTHNDDTAASISRRTVIRSLKVGGADEVLELASSDPSLPEVSKAGNKRLIANGSGGNGMTATCLPASFRAHQPLGGTGTFAFRHCFARATSEMPRAFAKLRIGWDHTNRYSSSRDIMSDTLASGLSTSEGDGLLEAKSDHLIALSIRSAILRDADMQ